MGCFLETVSLLKDSESEMFKSERIGYKIKERLGKDVASLFSGRIDDLIS